MPSLKSLMISATARFGSVLRTFNLPTYRPPTSYLEHVSWTQAFVETDRDEHHVTRAVDLDDLAVTLRRSTVKRFVDVDAFGVNDFYQPSHLSHQLLVSFF